MSKALGAVENAEHLLNIKTVVALFIQTMTTFNFNTTAMSSFLLVLFEKYAELLKARFSEDFVEIVSTDDYMPMPIQNAEEFEKVVNVSWYTPERPLESMTFPTVFPFSQMYPLCCIDIRNFLNQFYFFSDETFPNPALIDTRLQQSLDDLLSNRVCSSLISRLASQYLGQVVQILINLSHFSTACHELETLLVAARSSPSPPTSAIHLAATNSFMTHQKTAENRIFELVNQKVSDLVETAEYEWTSHNTPSEPSSYIVTLTGYLSNIMNSVLLSLPTELKELMLFNAISHTASSILSLPLSPTVSRISPPAVQQLSLDISHLTSYVNTLPNAIVLLSSLSELTQTIDLLKTDSPDDFYDISMRNKKYRDVDPLNGPQLLEKLTHETPKSPTADRFSGSTGTIGRAGMAREGLAAFQQRFMHGNR